MRHSTIIKAFFFKKTSILLPQPFKTRIGIVLGILLFISSCGHENQNNTKNTLTTNNNIVVDSAYSKFDKGSMTFKNVSYSAEAFYYQKQFQKFICKTTAINKRRTAGLRPYEEKREFYDDNMHKVFELNAKRRTITLSDHYYITEGLSSEIPRIFELNDYHTGKSFVKCTSTFGKIKIPNSETIGYIGYQISHNFQDTSTIGTYYFSINQTKNVRLIVKAKNKDLLQRISLYMPFRLESNNPVDFLCRKHELILKSKDGQKGHEAITDINLVIKANYNRRRNAVGNPYFVEYKIPIIRGEFQANKVATDTYEYIIHD